MRLAYLCNLYPAVSHSFVRREIEGVEAAGHMVHRFTLRPPPDNLRDEADLRKRPTPKSVLAQGLLRLAIGRPVLCCRATGENFLRSTQPGVLARPGLKSKLRHVAYWLEAAWLVRRLGSAWDRAPSRPLRNQSGGRCRDCHAPGVGPLSASPRTAPTSLTRLSNSRSGERSEPRPSSRRSAATDVAN